MRPPRRSSAPAWLAATLVVWSGGGLASAVDATSGDVPAIDPAAAHALGRVLTAGPTPTGLTLLSSAGYGYTESVLGTGDAHHRLAGALAVDGRPLSWLGLALRLDGRYDAHVVPGRATDSGLVGDPRVYARVDRGWSGGLSLGTRAGLWLPGRNAPSVDVGALSPELVGLASYAPPSGPLALSANLGYRLDRSAHSAPDAAQLGAGDRLALEVSAFDEVVAGVAATWGRGRAQGFLEASADLLVGSGAPPASSSPMWVGGGTRVAVSRDLRVEAEIEISPSRRPASSAAAPLAPIPPRFAAWVGLAYGFGAPPPAPPPPSAVRAPPTPAALDPVPPRRVTLRGRVSASDGGTLAELRVEITGGGARRSASTDEGGHFSVDGQPGDELTIAAEAAGRVPARATVTLGADAANTVELTLEPRAPRGQIRGLVRSLRGAAVPAEVVVEPEAPGADHDGDTKPLRAQGGRFQIDVIPGRYRVTIAAPGYEVQKRKVEVEENGVTLLNVDLRRER